MLQIPLIKELWLAKMGRDLLCHYCQPLEQLPLQQMVIQLLLKCKCIQQRKDTTSQNSLFITEYQNLFAYVLNPLIIFLSQTTMNISVLSSTRHPFRYLKVAFIKSPCNFLLSRWNILYVFSFQAPYHFTCSPLDMFQFSSVLRFGI